MRHAETATVLKGTTTISPILWTSADSPLMTSKYVSTLNHAAPFMMFRVNYTYDYDHSGKCAHPAYSQHSRPPLPWRDGCGSYHSRRPAGVEWKASSQSGVLSLTPNYTSFSGNHGRDFCASISQWGGFCLASRDTSVISA